MEKYELKIGKYIGFLWVGRYPNNRIAILFNDINTNENIEVLTTNLADYECDENHLFLNVNNNLQLSIDNDIVNIFLHNELITEVVSKVQSGFVSYPKCKISNKLKKIINNFWKDKYNI